MTYYCLFCDVVLAESLSTAAVPSLHIYIYLGYRHAPNNITHPNVRLYQECMSLLYSLYLEAHHLVYVLASNLSIFVRAYIDKLSGYKSILHRYFGHKID